MRVLNGRRTTARYARRSYSGSAQFRLVRRFPCKMATGEIPEREGWPEGDPRAGISAPHDGIHVVAAGVEPRDDPAVSIQHTGVTIGDHTARRPDVAGIDPHGIERGLRDRPEAGITFADRRVPKIAVV